MYTIILSREHEHRIGRSPIEVSTPWTLEYSGGRVATTVWIEEPNSWVPRSNFGRGSGTRCQGLRRRTLKDSLYFSNEPPS